MDNEHPAVTKFREAISRYGHESAIDGETNVRQLAGFITGYLFCAQDYAHVIPLDAIMSYAERVMRRIVANAQGGASDTLDG